MTSLSISVPGKIMLAGEYSVLAGGRSLAMCVSHRLRAKISPAKEWLLSSNIWNRSLSPTDPSTPPSPLVDTVRWALKTWNPEPFHLEINSDIVVSDGLGSSSAVRLAALVAIARYEGREESLWDLAKVAWLHQKEMQGFASGYDIATQCLGGLALMDCLTGQTWPGELRSPAWRHLEALVHPYRGGRGAPTEEVGTSTRAWLVQNKLDDVLKERSEGLVDALLECNTSLNALTSLIEQVAQHRGIFESCPSFPRHLLRAFKELEGFDRTWTFKTTGAGGEDTLLLIGQEPDLVAARNCLSAFNWHPLQASFSSFGILIDEDTTTIET